MESKSLRDAERDAVVPPPGVITVMILHIAALQISGPRELRRDMLFSVGTGLIIKPL